MSAVRGTGDRRSRNGPDDEQPHLARARRRLRTRRLQASAPGSPRYRPPGCWQGDHRQAQADCDGRKTLWCSVIGGAQNDVEEERRHHDLDDESGDEPIATWRAIPVTVRSKAALYGTEPRLTRRDCQQQAPAAVAATT